MLGFIWHVQTLLSVRKMVPNVHVAYRHLARAYMHTEDNCTCEKELLDEPPAWCLNFWMNLMPALFQTKEKTMFLKT